MPSPSSTPSRAIFVFPSAAGHLNPSLPLARGLVRLGWAVDYLATPHFREAIEDTGATFWDRDGVCRDAGIEDVTAMVLATAKQYSDPPPQWWLNFGSISTERLLPVYVEWLRSRSAQLVVYCPVLCQVAYFAAIKLQVPAVSLLTAAGPGYFDAAIAAMAGAGAVRGVAAGLVAAIGKNALNIEAIESIRSQLEMPELTLNSTEPLCCDYYARTNLVSTTEELADPMNPQDVEFYAAAGKSFSFVGPLIDVAGAKRGHSVHLEQHEAEQQDLLRRVEAAAASGRQVVYVSMGTVLTSDHAEHGWSATSGSGISGQQLCQSVYRAVFDELGSAALGSSWYYQDDGGVVQGPFQAEHMLAWMKEGHVSDRGDLLARFGERGPFRPIRALYSDLTLAFTCPPTTPLIVVSLGPEPDALGGVSVPLNAVCAVTVAQVDLLRLGKPALFVTNGGQNSLMESMTVGTPVLVCPGFGDQVSNAAKVVAQGWGTKVDRPPPAVAKETPMVDLAVYQAAVQDGVREVLAKKEFAEKAQFIADGLKKAEGVEGALRILIEAASR